MSEKPILFNTEMVKAIMEGRKTVTRRTIKPKSKNAAGFYVTFRESDNQFMGVYDYGEDEFPFESSQAPPCQVGDILYVRETFANTWTPNNDEGFAYKADGEPPRFPYWGNAKQCKDEVWIPSIHMPRAAARIFLRITNVRVERLHDITTEQILKEGVNYDKEIYEMPCNIENAGESYLKGCFRDLWDSTIKKEDIEAYSFKANPWVWVIEFSRIEKEGTGNEQ